MRESEIVTTSRDAVPAAPSSIALPKPQTQTVGYSPRRSQPTKYDEEIAPSPVEAEFDGQWQAELARWLGQLVAALETCPRPTYQSDLVPAVNWAADLVNRSALFMSEHLVREGGDASPIAFLEQVGLYLANAGRIASSNGRTSWWKWRTSGAEAVPIAECGRLIQDLPRVLEASFAHLGSRFRLRESMLVWMESSDSFLGELRQTIQWSKPLANSL